MDSPVNNEIDSPWSPAGSDTSVIFASPPEENNESRENEENGKIFIAARV
jgi:hypothetical protein